MPTIYARNAFTGNGVSASDNRDIVYDMLISGGETLSAGITGTAGATGAMTVLAGHGLTDNDVVCVSGTFGENYNGTVTGAGATGFTVSGGTGDALPVTGAVVISKQVELDIAFTGANLVALSVGATQPMLFTLEDAGGVELMKITVANGAYMWDSGNGDDNPVTGDSITVAHCYNLGVTAGTASVTVAYDND